MVFSNFLFSIITKGNRRTIMRNIMPCVIFAIPFYIYRNSLHVTSFFLIYFINNVFLFLINYKSVRKLFHKGIASFPIMIFLLLNISLFLEFTLFNFRSYTTFPYQETVIHLEDIKTNLKKISSNVYKVSGNEKPYIEIKNIHKKVHNIYFDITNNSGSFQIVPFYTDSGNALYQQAESRFVSSKISKSKTLNFNTNGKSEKMKFVFETETNDVFTIHHIILNYSIPLEVNVIRIFLVFTVLLFVYFFRPKSLLYTICFSDFKWKNLFLIGFIFLIIFTYSAMSIHAILSVGKNGRNIHNVLADSILHGKTYFTDLNHSEELLKTMKNPYDHNLREKIFKEHNRTYLWDCAYYKGKYYSYFGVVPVVLFYLPYKVVTNSSLQTGFLCYVLSMLTAIMLILLLYQIVQKFFKKCSLGLFGLLGLVLIYCTGILYVLKMPTLYAVPIISGLFFTFLGLYLLISCLGAKSKKIKIFFGGFSLALVAGCRPQLLLGSFFLIPIFFLYLREKPDKKEIIGNVIILCIPYVLVAACLMYYNYIRFSSVFDFGANYNLTTNDMTGRGFHFDRIPLGLCFYLLNPVHIKNVFPYIIDTGLFTNYLGITIYEPMYGGVFFSVLFTSLNLFLFSFKDKINNTLLFRVCLFCIISAVTIVVADTQMAGILARYITDFSWLLVFSSTLIVLALYENRKIKKEFLLKLVFMFITVSLVYQFFYYFVSTNDVFRSTNLRIWSEFYYLIQFWL